MQSFLLKFRISTGYTPRNKQRYYSSCKTWASILEESKYFTKNEPILSRTINHCILSRKNLAESISVILASKLSGKYLEDKQLHNSFSTIVERNPSISAKAKEDLDAYLQKDPATDSFVQPLLLYKGYLALQASRISHQLWNDGRKFYACLLQSRISEVFNVDIHPAAKIGKGIMIDHATGIVIGETTEIKDDCSILHNVTLGGNGKESGDRHPKLGRQVVIGAGATILGNISIGDCSIVAAGSVVLQSVPKCTTVAGVPSKIVRHTTFKNLS